MVTYLYRLFFAASVFVIINVQSIFCQMNDLPTIPSQIDTNDYIAFYNRGVLHTIRKEYDLALRDFYSALNIYPHHSESHYAIYCAELLKDKELYKQSLEKKPSSEKTSKIEEIKNHYHEAFIYNPFFDRSLTSLFFTEKEIRAYFIYGLEGFTEFFQGKYLVAAEDLGVIIIHVPDFTQARFLRGIAYEKIGAYDAAIEDFNYIIGKLEEYNKTKVLPIYLSTADLQYMIGFCYLQERRYYPAETAFKTVLEQDMGFYMAHFQYSIAQIQKGSIQPAIQELNLAIDLQPKDGILYSNKAAFLAQQGQLQEAAVMSEKAAVLMPRYSPIYFNLAKMYHTYGDTAKALLNYEMYLKCSPQRDSLNREFAKKTILIFKGN